MKKLSKIGLAVLCLGLICCVWASVSYAQVSWTDVSIEKEYEKSSEFHVPKREIVIKGKKVTATATVKIPNGEVTNKDTIILDAAGKYTVLYTAIVEEKSYADEISFRVFDDLYSFNSPATSVSYGKYEYAKSEEGLMIRLRDLDKFTLNEVIDLDSLDENDCLIEAFATPDVPGSPDFKELYFTLTDAYNPEITLTIRAKQIAGNGLETNPETRVSAGGNGQLLTGWDDVRDRLHVNDLFGTRTVHSFGLGHKDCTYPDEQSIKLKFDKEENQVCVGDRLVADLDSYKHFTTKWNGFPSGKVILSITAGSYTDSGEGHTANFCLKTAGKVDLTATKVLNSTPPLITVDAENDNMPAALKGATYSVPEASACALNGEKCEVKVSAWYNYNSPNSALVEIEDNKFTTAKFGHYAIVYEATDKAGNVGTEILWVKAEKKIDKPSIMLKEDPKTVYVVGERLLPLKYETECYSGSPSVKIYAKLKNKSYDIKDGLLLKKKGNYTVVYQVTDHIGQTSTCEYNITVKQGDIPILVDDVVLPKYMIEGVKYTLPKVYFNDYSSGKLVRKLATITVDDLNGKKSIASGKEYTPQVKQTGDKVTIIFECEKVSYKVEIPTIKGMVESKGKQELVRENFFVGNGFTCLIEDGLVFKATASNGGWCFANKLLLEGFKAELKGISTGADFESLIFEMRDSVDSSQVLTVELPNTQEYISTITGSKDGIESGKIGTVFSTEDSINITYVDGLFCVNGKQLNDEKFSGFKSGYVYFSVRFKGATNKSSFRLISLNEHMMNSKSDKTASKIVVTGAYGGSYAVNDKIVLPTAIAADVINPNVTFTMTVKMGNEIVKDANGTTLDKVDPCKEYTIKAEKCGDYQVVYTATDDLSNRTTFLNYMIYVVDEEKPEVKFEKAFKDEVKLGDTICIPDFSISDNYTKDEDLVIVKGVYNPNGMFVYIPQDSNSIVATLEGKYELLIMVTDKAGNTYSKTHTVAVIKD